MLDAFGDVGKALFAFLAALIAARLGWRAAFYVLAGAGILAAAQFAATKRPPREQPSPAREHGALGITNQPLFIYATFVGILASLCRGAALTFLAFFLIQKGIEKANVGAFFSAYYIAGALARIGCGALADGTGSRGERSCVRPEGAAGWAVWAGWAAAA